VAQTFCDARHSHGAQAQRDGPCAVAGPRGIGSAPRAVFRRAAGVAGAVAPSGALFVPATHCCCWGGRSLRGACVASGHGFVGLGGAGARSGGVAQSTLPRLQQRSLRYEAPLHRGEFLGAVAERCLCVIAMRPAASLAALVPDMLERGASAWPHWDFYVCGSPRKSLSPTAHEESSRSGRLAPLPW